MKYSGTLLPQTNDPVEIQKGHLDLLSKVNQTNSDLTDKIDSGNSDLQSQIDQTYNPGTIDVAVSTTWSKFSKDLRVRFTSSSATLQDIATNGASTPGITVIFENIGAGLVSINWDGTGNVAQVPINGVAGFIWSGTQWKLLTPVSGSNAGGNWEKFPDRRMICSGGENLGAGVITVTFPIPFATSSYEYALMVYNNGSTTELYTANAIFSAQTTTGMQYRKKFYIPGGAGGDATQPSTWIVRGYY